MILTDLTLHHCLLGDEEYISQITPDLYTGIQYELAQYIHKAGSNVTADTVRTAINADGKQKNKAGLHSEIARLLSTAYGRYDEAVSELREKVVLGKISILGAQLASAGSDTCTLDDVDRIVEDIHSLKSTCSIQEGIHDFDDVALDVLTRPAEALTDERLYLNHPVLKKVFQDFLAPRLYVISGQPSMGKSVVVDNLCVDLMAKHHGLYFSYDNNAEETATSILSIMSDVPYEYIYNRTLVGDQCDKIAAGRNIIKSKLAIVTRKQYPRQIKSTVDKVVKQYHAKFMILDYFQNIPTGEHDKVRHLEDATIIFKDICRKHNIPVIVLSQLSQDGSTKWCKGLHEEAYFHLKVEGDPETADRDLVRAKFKRGERCKFKITFNFRHGYILDFMTRY